MFRCKETKEIEIGDWDWMTLWMQQGCTCKHTEIHCNILQHAATHRARETEQESLVWLLGLKVSYTCTCKHTATHCNMVQHNAIQCNTVRQTARARESKSLQHGQWDWKCLVYVLVNVLQHTATHCSTSQHTATHDSALHHTVRARERARVSSIVSGIDNVQYMYL